MKPKHIKLNKKEQKLHKKLEIEEESIGNMAISAESLKSDWNNRYDQRWNKYKKGSIK